MKPEDMTLICNIQAMGEKIGREYAFKFLQTLNTKQLRELQDKMVFLYNEEVVCEE